MSLEPRAVHLSLASAMALQKAASSTPSIESRFKPDLTPEQMEVLGTLIHRGSQYKDGDPKDNYFGVQASMEAWPESWHNDQHPQGWYQWYKGYHAGKRTDDDERQIKRWLSFKARHLAQLQKADPTLSDLSVQPKRRQALLNWGIAPGIDVESEVSKKSQNKYIEKVARKVKQVKQDEQDEQSDHGLGPHQEDALRKLDENGGIILSHSTGSGKTKTFLVAVKKALDKADKDQKALILAPASLTSNIDKELEKHKIDIPKDRLVVKSYEKAVRDSEELSKENFAIAVADEAQKFRNSDTKRTKVLSGIVSSADKRVLATATPNYNHFSDLAPLLNIAAGHKVVPEDPDRFASRYSQFVGGKPTVLGSILRTPDPERLTLKNKRELKKVFDKHVHYYDSVEDSAAQDKFPSMKESTIDVEMSPEQQKYYRFVEGKVPVMIRWKIRNNLPLDKKESADLNAFSIGVRQAANGYRHLVDDKESAEVAPKIAVAADRLHKRMLADKNFRGMVYSNFLPAGLHEYSRVLSKKGIKHTMFTGELSKAEKAKAVEAYNSGEVPVMLVSSSGSEGLDLKGTKLIQVLEPHFNKSKIKQVIGRGRRYESHAHLPPEERHVDVEHYRSVLPKPTFGVAPYSIDRYLSEHSDSKDELFDEVRNLMRASND